MHWITRNPGLFPAKLKNIKGPPAIAPLAFASPLFLTRFWKSMNPRSFIAILIGASLGCTGTYLVMKKSVPTNSMENQETNETVNGPNFDDPFANSPVDDPFATSAENESDPFAEEESTSQLEKLSGKWVSVDGMQTAELDLRTLRFGPSTDWPDLNNRFFLISENMQFMTNSGYYDLISRKPNKIRVIKEDLENGDLTSFNLYREGSPHARSRKPLADKAHPEKVRALLDLIPTIKKGEKMEDVMTRLGLANEELLEPLAGESGLGQSDWVYGLRIDNEYMLRLSYLTQPPNHLESEAVIFRFQIVRGYIDDIRNSRDDMFKLVYPYFR